MSDDLNVIYYKDCMLDLVEFKNNSVDMVLTDIPYGKVNKPSNGLRELDKKEANTLDVNLEELLVELDRITKNSIVIFCGREQFSQIYEYFDMKKQGTARPLIWAKTNPSPMNGQYVYLNGVELAVWYRKPGGTFNAHCKTNVFRFPNGTNKIHPTQKNLRLFEELILDNTNDGDVVLDPFIGSGTTAVACMNTGRKFIGYENNLEYYNGCMGRIKANDNKRTNQTY